MKATKTGENTKGTKFAVTCEQGKFFVLQLCANYNGRVRGGLSYTWRYIGLDMTAEAADALFARRLKGRA
jgi:hypothetical protein